MENCQYIDENIRLYMNIYALYYLSVHNDMFVFDKTCKISSKKNQYCCLIFTKTVKLIAKENKKQVKTNKSSNKNIYILTLKYIRYIIKTPR